MYKNAAMVYPMEPKLTTYSNQTGRFPHRSSRGNKYLMIMYNYDSNAILAAPLKKWQAKTITEAWETLHKKWPNMDTRQKTSSLTTNAVMIWN